MISFLVNFSDGKLVSWHPSTYTSMTRNPKPRQPEEPTNLITKAPPADISSEDFDMIKFVEGHEISLKPGTTEPTDADIFSLVNLLFSVSSDVGGKTIDSRCDTLSIVAKKIPELSILIEKHNDGKIPLPTLNDLLKPYVFGEKTLK